MYIAPQSVQREFYESSVGSGMNMAIGTFIMFTFAICTLGRCEVVGGRKLVACVGIVSVWLAVGAAFGVSMWCGYIYTPFSQFMPLLALGVLAFRNAQQRLRPIYGRGLCGEAYD